MSTTQISDRIAKDNAAFRKMSKARRRVAIARDVIAQLALGKLTAQKGTYVRASGLGYIGPDEQLQTALASTSVTCEVCGIGALFVCGVIRANDATRDQVGASSQGTMGGGGTSTYLRRFFSGPQLVLIEAAFEGWLGYGEHAYSFHNAVSETGAKGDKIRLRLIMENIIKNKGTFVPTQLPVRADYVTPGFKG